MRPYLYASVLVAVVGVVLAVVGFWEVVVLGALALGVTVALTEWRCRRAEETVASVGAKLVETLDLVDAPEDAERLGVIVDRLGATFGLGDVAISLVNDDGLNATLVADGTSLRLLVTTGMSHHFELVELEGVIAHLMARQRLGSIARSAAASQPRLDVATARRLAGVGGAYRADEVAAAGIRYPQGLQQALAHCAATTTPPASYFRTPAYAASRWVWFDRYADRAPAPAGDLDTVEVRARALAEW